MDIKVIFIFLLPLLFFLLPNYFIYASFNNFFNITSAGLKVMLFFFLILMGLLLPLSAYLMRTNPLSWVNGLNYAGSLWYGFFIYLIMAIFVAWLLLGIGALLGLTLSKSLIMLLAVCSACWMTGVGFLQAQQVKVKNITVSLKQLPDYWKNRRIIHLSDLHLGAVQNREFLEKLNELLSDLTPDLILITGDLFDGINGSIKPFQDQLSRMKSRNGVYFVTGNHEGYLGLKEPLEVIKQAGIKNLDYEIKTIKGLQLIGIPFPEHHQENRTLDLFKANGPYQPDQASILLYHTPTNIMKANHKDRGDQQMTTYWSPDAQFDFAKEKGIDLQLSGHTHQGQFWPFNLLTRRIFKSYDYGLHQDGDFQIYTTSGTGTWGPPLRLASRSEVVVITLKQDKTDIVE